MARAWIELDGEQAGWGPTQVMVSKLSRDGYFAQVRGVVMSSRWVFNGSSGAVLWRVVAAELSGLREGAAMRLVIRVLLFECALSWVLVLAGWVRAAAQIWPFAKGTLTAGFRGRSWRVRLGLLVGLPVAVGWPVLFWPVMASSVSVDWLRIAAPWWVLVGSAGFLVLAAKLSERGSRRERGTGCRCGTCVAYGL